MPVRNQKGSILVIVVVVVLSLTIMAATLGSLAITDQKQTLRQQKKTEAYYLARSGAEAVAAHLIQNPEYVGNVLAQAVDEFFLGEGKVSVRVTEAEGGELWIESTGYVGDFSERVSLSLVPGGPAGPYFPVFDMAVFSNGSIEIERGARVIGNVGTNTEEPGGIRLDNSRSDLIMGNCYVGPNGNIETVIPNNRHAVTKSISNLDKYREYPMPKFPECPELPWRGNYLSEDWSSGGWNENCKISSGGHYGTVTVNTQLVFDVGNGKLYVRINRLEFTGSGACAIKIKGNGQLVLFIDEYFGGKYQQGIEGSTIVNIDGDPNQLMIYYSGANSVRIGGNAKINGHYFSKSESAGLTITNGTGIIGSIFVNGPRVEVSGGSRNNYVRVLYAPNAHLVFGGSGSVTGAVICDSFFASGGDGYSVVFDPEVAYIWDFIPEIEFDPVEGTPQNTGYSLGSWSD